MWCVPLLLISKELSGQERQTSWEARRSSSYDRCAVYRRLCYRSLLMSSAGCRSSISAIIANERARPGPARPGSTASPRSSLPPHDINICVSSAGDDWTRTTTAMGRRQLRRARDGQHRWIAAPAISRRHRHVDLLHGESLIRCTSPVSVCEFARSAIKGKGPSLRPGDAQIFQTL